MGCSWTRLLVDSLLRSASVGRERPTATPAAALPLIKLRESASKSDQKLDDSTRGVAAQRKAGRRRQGPARHAGPLARRRDGTGGESERRRHGIADSSAAVLPAHGKRPCCRHLFREYQACMGASADPLPVPSCGVAFRPERCRRITSCALHLQQCQQDSGNAKTSTFSVEMFAFRKKKGKSSQA